uniref:Uncharacterized protein n=1 Tax=Callorhinchus milii TaxID=7868 RepID=A0A4W3GMW0_CALMI
MEFPNKLLLCQCVAYFLGLLLSLLVVVPLAENGSRFGDRCLLFSEASWRQENATGGSSVISRFVVGAWGPPAGCHFCTFVGVFTLIFSAAQAWRTFFYLCKGHDDALTWSVMVSVGFSLWCDEVTDHGRMPNSCEEMQSMNLHLDVDTSSFYIHFRVAQVSLKFQPVLACTTPSPFLRIQ